MRVVVNFFANAKRFMEERTFRVVGAMLWAKKKGRKREGDTADETIFRRQKKYR